MINDFIINSIGLDKNDMSIILQEHGTFPLASSEREYLESLYDSFQDAISLISALLNIVEKDNRISAKKKKKIIRAMENMIFNGHRILEVSIDDIGHGYKFERKIDDDDG